MCKQPFLPSSFDKANTSAVDTFSLEEVDDIKSFKPASSPARAQYMISSTSSSDICGAMLWSNILDVVVGGKVSYEDCAEKIYRLMHCVEQFAPHGALELHISTLFQSATVSPQANDEE
jgi:hypothetical protein